MKSIFINGGKPLYGRVSVEGSKNAALPILFATILTRGVSSIKKLPEIGDVEVALDILRGLGAKIKRGENTVFIDTEEMFYSVPDSSLVSRIRASTYLIGSCLSRFGKCEVLRFGGCNFSDRPIDLHILAARALGASFDGDRLTAEHLFGGEIILTKPSVGATVNSILLAACADGETVIRGAAKEPHIDSLIEFLASAGADIFRSADEIRIKGRKLHGGSITVPPDMIEAGTYLTLGLVTGGEISVEGCLMEQLSSVTDAFAAFGAEIAVSDGAVSVKCANMREAEIVAAPYPGFPTDLQPIFAVVAARFFGGKITDTVWNSRFGYLAALSKFGVEYSLGNGCAVVHRSRFAPSKVTSPDLRGGMACIMAALIARGESIVDSFETVERGYAGLCEKLLSLGADVKQ